MFRKSLLFIVFQLSWLVISEAALAQLTQLEGQSHRFQYVDNDQTIDINLDPAIGRVTHVAAVQLTRYTRFYIETENGSRYLYAYYETVRSGQSAQLPKTFPPMHKHFLFLGSGTTAGSDVFFREVLPVLVMNQQERIWTTIEVSDIRPNNDYSKLEITINNPSSQLQSNWNILNECYSGRYTILEELSLL